jgi:hypothetical protein
MLPTKFQFITTGNSCFSLANFFKSSPLKPLGQMNRNFVGSIYGRSSVKIAHFVPIRLQTWPPDDSCLDASYQVSVHLAKGFQRRRLKCEKLTDDGRQVMAKAHIAFGKVS